MEKHENSTKENYHGIWKNFNRFIIRLDVIPSTWEDRLTLFIGHLADNGIQSSTIKSYISAIKAVLEYDDHKWDEDKLKINALTKACSLRNDTVKVKLPIQNGFLEQLLFELERLYDQQAYLEILYRTMMLLQYFGLLRVGEITKSKHVLKAKDIHIPSYGSKEKLKLYLYSSKTHGKSQIPQEIKIEGNVHLTQEKNSQLRHFDPYNSTREYLAIRGNYRELDEQLFIFRDGTPVRACNYRKVLKTLLKAVQVNPDFYDTHSFRIGRATDLRKFGYTIEQIKHLGRWRSNAVYRYLKF